MFEETFDDPADVRTKWKLTLEYTITEDADKPRDLVLSRTNSLLRGDPSPVDALLATDCGFLLNSLKASGLVPYPMRTAAELATDFTDGLDDS